MTERAPLSIQGWRRPLVVLALLAAVLVPAGLFLPDLGLRWGVVRGLVDLGWARASVTQAKLSLVKGAVAIRGMQAISALGQALGVDGIDLTFRWKPLLSRRLWLERLDFDHADVVLTRTPQGWRLNGLALPGGDDPQASLPWGWGVTALTLTDSRLTVEDAGLRVVIDIERLELRDLASWVPLSPATLSVVGHVNGAPLTLEGSLHPFAAAPALDLTAKIDGLDLAPFAQRGGLAGWAGRLGARIRLTGSAGDGTVLGLDGRLDLSDALVPLDGGKVTAARLGWQGNLRLDGAIDGSGTLKVEQLQFSQGDARIGAASAQVRLDRGQLDQDRRHFTWSGGLEAQDWALTMDGLSVRHQHLTWSGESRFFLSPQAKTWFTAKGQAESVATSVRYDDWRLDAAKLSAVGEFAHHPPRGILPPVAGAMTLRVDTLAVRQNGLDWLVAEQARLRDLVAAQDALTLGHLEASGVGVLARGNQYGPRIRARTLVADKIRLDADGGVQAESLALAQPVIRVNRDLNGIEGLRDLPPGRGMSSGRSSPGADGSQAAAPPLRFALGRLRLTGGRLEFRDRAPRDPVRLSLRDLALSLTGLDSAKPEQDSSFSFGAALGTGTVAAQGAVRPFRPTPDLDLSATATALDLPPLSPYAADAMGVNLHTGQLDAKAKLAVRDGTLDGRMDLVLSRLRVAQPDPDAPLAKQADMPVETLLDLLRDGDDRISLSIPVQGDLDNPAFDTSDAVNQAIGGALRATMFTTLKVAFPLVGLIGMVIDEAERPVLALQSLPFAAGSGEVPADALPALEKVGGFLNGHQGVRLNLCGVATSAADGPALRHQASLGARLRALLEQKDREEVAEFERDRLRRLAEQRAAAVKDWLVAQGEVDPGRLFLCRPRIDDAPQASPRVDLVL